MKNLGAFIPVRLGSERLPGKALKKICGRPVLYHLLDRVCASRFLQKENVVVCTTLENIDDELVEAACKYGVQFFRGSTDDIIKRFHGTFNQFNFDAVILASGDDPLCDPEYMDLTLQTLIDNPFLDFVGTSSLPVGLNSCSFTRKAMDKVFAHYLTKENDTGFSYYFSKSGLCNVGVVKPLSPNHVLDEARVTLDYQKDLDFFTQVFEALYVESEIFGINELITYLKANPELMKVNNFLDAEYRLRTAQKFNLSFLDKDGVIQHIHL